MNYLTLNSSSVGEMLLFEPGRPTLLFPLLTRCRNFPHVFHLFCSMSMKLFEARHLVSSSLSPCSTKHTAGFGGQPHTPLVSCPPGFRDASVSRPGGGREERLPRVS